MYSHFRADTDESQRRANAFSATLKPEDDRLTTTRSNGPQLTLLFVTLTVAALAVFGAPGQMVSQFAYAVERGKLRADTEELVAADQNLAQLSEVSRAFQLAAAVAKPGVVHISVSPEENAHERIVELHAERRLLDEQREELEDQLNGDQTGSATAAEVMQLYFRLREIREELEDLSESMSSASGSGIVFDDEGHILTNNHVISSRGSITVRLPDQREYEARVIGADSGSDLAVIKIDASDLHPLKFGDSDKADVGDWVIAVGSPFGLSQTVTHGIISATNRNDVTSRRSIPYQNFLQTDAAINPGNSGGPLLNLRGEVIGINTAIATNDGRNAGIAFTIPSKMALKIADQLKRTGEVARGWLGITMYELDRAERDIFGISEQRGVMVQGVIEDSPADRAGLRVEDVIVDVEGATVTNLADLGGAIANISPGQKTKLKLIRGGEPQNISVALGRRPDDRQFRTQTQSQRAARRFDDLGVRARTLLPGIAANLGYRDDERGALVVALADEDSETPLLRGEVIISCNDAKIVTAADLERALSARPRNSRVTLEVVSPDGERRIVTVDAD